jgi:hypothetical protein
MGHRQEIWNETLGFPVDDIRAGRNFYRAPEILETLEDEGTGIWTENDSGTGSYDMTFGLELPGVRKTSTAAPRLIKQERHPFGETYYVGLTLGGEGPNPPMTGIFIPANYRSESHVDMLIYLHGHYAEMPLYRFLNKDIYPHRAFREETYSSGKNVIFVIPTLGPKSQSGKLSFRGGFDAYLHSVLAALAAYGPHKSTGSPEPGHIILACHSDGGASMLRINLRQDHYTQRIRECWGFDCLYSGRNKQTGTKYFTIPRYWMNWAKANKDKKLFIYYLNTTAEHSTAEESRYLERHAGYLGNVFVNKSSAKSFVFKGERISGHSMVPITHWKNRLQNTWFLASR